MKLKNSIKNMTKKYVKYENHGDGVGAGCHPCPARDAYPMHAMHTNNHGITLIALVVTIIVLLILAGVSLNLIAGSNGILGRATTAVNQTKQAADEERRELAQAEALMHDENEIYTDKNGAKAIIPAGFAPTGIDGETEISTGLVITDSQGNEFVWIPVANEAAYVKTAGQKNAYMISGSSGWESTTETIANMVAGDILGLDSIVGNTVTSTLSSYPEKVAVINEAKANQGIGGFWVSRYEAGSNLNVDSTTIDWVTETIVCKKGEQPARYITQQTALTRANNWLSNSNVQSGLITGTQWDLMCDFIGRSIADGDCTKWGNYGNTVGASYIGYHSPDAGTNEGNCAWDLETTAVVKKGDYTNSWVFPTGTFVTEKGRTTVQKNIYDIAGNVNEWTTEQPKISSSNTVFRGGSADSNGGNRVASYRYGYYAALTGYAWFVGFRFVLYVSI